MSVPVGYEPYRILGDTLFATDSASIYFETDDKDEAIEIAKFSTTFNRSFRMKAVGTLHVLTGSSFQQLDLTEQKEFDFKQIL